MNKVSFFTGPNDGKTTCIAYDKDCEPVLTGRGGFGKPMQVIVVKEGEIFNTTIVLLTWLANYYPQEVDKQFVIENNPELITYLRKNKIDYE